MSYSIERLHAQNYDEFMDFINMVFSQDLMTVHFQEDLPLLFAPDEEHMQNQYVIREDGRIRSAVGTIPYTFLSCGESFQTKTITNVTTHYHYTGRGYMQALFRRALEDMRQEKVDFVTLHGNRERYRFMGFENAGICTTASFTRENVLNRKKRGVLKKFSFRRLEDNDLEGIQTYMRYFEAQPQRYVRPAHNFMQTMHMWHGEAYLVLDEQKKICGALNYNAKWTPMLKELFLEDESEADQVIAAFILEMNLSKLNVAAYAQQPVMMRSLYRSAQSVSNGGMCMMQVFSLERLLASCLNMKLQLLPELPQGELVLECMFGRFVIRNDGKFTVERTEKKPMLEVPDYEIYSFLFGPSELLIPYDKKGLGELAAWFPVPIIIHDVDRY